MLQTFIRPRDPQKNEHKYNKKKENCVNNSLVLFGLLFNVCWYFALGLTQTEKETVYYSSSDF